ncbi:hypothetical protein ANCCAN_25264 [Ancylostoma caninum]|uniref:ShTK domain protein n=1 Tax=Ancylostoma caninum TaxID=29170 RepID=A0A368FAA8_ANCCA|nr:hypothetical protein ANCCAN_25264 [Ancylostoma caninum]
MNRWIVVVLISSMLFSQCIALKNCFPTWMRCTPETKWGTCTLWHSCPDYCRKCQGKADGACSRTYTEECNGGWRCKCIGRDVPKSTNPLVMGTCRFGL